MNDDIEQRHLPVWRTVKAAYLVIFYNPGIALKLAIVPLVLSILSAGVFAWFFAGSDVNAIATDPSTMAFSIGTTIVVYGSMIPTITAWHRMVLLGHGNPDARIVYSIRASEWLYLWKGFLFILIMFLISIPTIVFVALIGGIVGALGAAGEGNATGPVFMAFFIGVAVVVNVFLYGCVLRFNLVFPSAAINEPMGFRESWRRTRGNTWRLFIIAFVTVFPFMVIPMLISGALFGFQQIPSVENQVISGLINTPFWLLGLCVGISFWSWSYRYLVQEMPISLPDE